MPQAEAFKYYRGNDKDNPKWSVIVLISDDGRVTFPKFSYPTTASKELKVKFLDEAETAAFRYIERHLKKE